MRAQVSTGVEETWRDPTASVEARVADLVDKMTLSEKLAQLCGIWLEAGAEGGEVAPHQHDLAPNAIAWPEVVRDGIGQLTRHYGTVPLDPWSGARSLARLQRDIRAASRFEIPALVHEECLTGLATWTAPVFPSPLCWGATFDPGLTEAMAAEIGGLMRRLGVHQGLAPVLDVARDLRWGRVEETIGEDPLLVGAIASGYVRGLQSAGIVATLKHYVGYSASRSGRNLAPVSLGARELADVFLPPFEMAIKAGARSVMNAYVDLDGLPVAADPELLTRRLRELYGFKGTVVADYFAIIFLHTLHGVARDTTEAGMLALEAGIDVELPSMACYGPALEEMVRSARLDVSLVDRALNRVLTQKCELGLLDADWQSDPEILSGSEDRLDTPEARRLARRVAERGIVLLANRQVLPLAPGTRLAVVGPLADEATGVLGDYSFPLHVGRRFPEVELGVELSTLRQVLSSDAAGYLVSYAAGCPVTGGDDEGIEQAVSVAAESDVCIAVLGDHAGLFGSGTSGEGCDAESLRLPGRQQELLEALVGTATPVVVVLLSGRPYDVSHCVDDLAALLWAFYPGEAGNEALAELLAGRANFSGRLPVSYPGRGGGQPGSYLGAKLAKKSKVSSVDPTPLFPFGYGLSYAEPEWVAVTGGGPQWATDGTFTITAELFNPHGRSTSEVVQVYLNDPVAEVARPLDQLIAFARVDLGPEQGCRVRFELPGDLTSYTGRAGERIVDPGEVELRVGSSCGDIRHRISTELTGARRRLDFSRQMEAKVAIESLQARASTSP